QKNLRSTLVEDEYQSLQAAIIYDEDEFAEKTIPRLEVWEKTMGGQVRTSVRVYADNYWLAIRNYTILSCGYLFDHQVSMFNGTSWTDIQTPAAEESFDIGAMPGLNGQRSKL
ncbi:MAG: hypothetical protein KDC44_14750, partial [Phaeodactylibacter sp.]|nr:hypothetical protein [Phaeodactylibacter sp.]